MVKTNAFRALLLVACLAAVLALAGRNLPTVERMFRLQHNAKSSQTPIIPRSREIANDTGASKVRILSNEPFIIHIQDFILQDERKYLLQISYVFDLCSRDQYLAYIPYLRSKPLFNPSRTGDEDRADKSRTSSSAFLPMEDPVVDRIAQRASQFQGCLRRQGMMEIQVTKYESGQQYRPHVDWWGDHEPDRSTDRCSTFFGILEADCHNCGTQFPRVPFYADKEDTRLCELLDCAEEVLTTKNIPGSVVYWRNLNGELRGRRDTIHAGLPSLNGTKVGLNIWTEIDITDKFSKL